jgi:hypothetical protein
MAHALFFYSKNPKPYERTDISFTKAIFHKSCCYLIIIPKESGVMNRKNPCLAREKRASLLVQSEKRSMQGENPAFGIFPEATIYAKTAFTKKVCGSKPVA